MSTLTYNEKKIIADDYLSAIAGLSWDDLSDINSLHDADSQQGIRNLCDARLREDGFPFDELIDE